MELAHKSTERELTQQNTKQEHLSEDLTHDSQSLSCDLIKTSLDDKMTKKPSIESKVESESIIHGEPLTDRKSTFQAHVAEVHSMDEVCTNHYLQERYDTHTAYWSDFQYNI